MIMSLCNRCADVYEEDQAVIIKRVDQDQRIKEPCMICNYGGYDYDVEHIEKNATVNK